MFSFNQSIIKKPTEIKDTDEILAENSKLLENYIDTYNLKNLMTRPNNF